jgi:uncharacterized membrane protein
MAAIGGYQHNAAQADRWDSLYISLVPLPFACMAATLVSDLLTWSTGGAVWLRASEWLLGAGLATGALAAADGLIRYISTGCIRPSRICWMHVVGNLLALLLSLSNLIYRLNEEPARAVMPAGIVQTAIVMCLLLFTARLGRDLTAQGGTREPDEPGPIWEDSPDPVTPEAPARPRPRQGQRRTRASRAGRSGPAGAEPQPPVP